MSSEITQHTSNQKENDFCWHVLCDEFSWFGWRHEGAQRIYGPEVDLEAWQTILNNPPETTFLLVESVWEGFAGCERLAEMGALITAFKRRGIPVAFWNKEDPAEFTHFLDVALLTDAIFTTDEDRRHDYRSSGFVGEVELLVFPVQDKEHRLYPEISREKEVLFAGAPWFHHPDRLAAYYYFLKPALSLGCVDVFARKSHLVNRNDWPDEVQPYIIGELSYQDLLKESCAYILGLSMSCSPSSPTMYPRRIVELPMAGVLPISDNNRAVRRYFPEIPVCSYASETKEVIRYFLDNPKERVERLEQLQKRIITDFTYAKSKSFVHDVLERVVVKAA